MTVSDALLDAALNREPEAIAMVNQWSHSTIAAKPSCPGPGFWLHGMNQRLMERVVGHGRTAACSIPISRPATPTRTASHVPRRCAAPYG